MPNLEPVSIIIRGPHNSGRTTLAHIISESLKEAGYDGVMVMDTQPLPAEEKPKFWERFQLNKQRRIAISVELVK